MKQSVSKKSRTRKNPVSEEEKNKSITLDISFREDDRSFTSDQSDNPRKMTDAETAQHLQLCMRLAAENKINVKNAFGLHLIDIMKSLVATKDLQEASLSLAASAHIYSCRVEALYKATMHFHGTLQNIASKKDSKKSNCEEEYYLDEENESNPTIERKEKKKLKSRLAAETEVTLSIDTGMFSKLEPHKNFVTINNSFTTSRTSRKLLHNVEVESDKSNLMFAYPENAINAKKPCSSVNIHLFRRVHRELKKLKNFDTKQSKFEKISSSLLRRFSSTPINDKRASENLYLTPIPLDLGPDNLSFGMDDSVHSPGEGNGLQAITENLASLNITSEIFTSSISKALTKKGIDHNLLPVDSVLKKMLTVTSATKTGATLKTKKRVIKTSEPFYSKRLLKSFSLEVAPLYLPSAKAGDTEEPAKWCLESTSNFEKGYVHADVEIDECWTTNFDLAQVLKLCDCDFSQSFFLQSDSKVIHNVEKTIHSFFSVSSVCKEKEALGEECAMEKTDGIHSIMDPLQNLSSIQHEEDFITQDEDNSSVGDVAPDFEAEHEISFIEKSTLQKLMVEPPMLVKPTYIAYEKKPCNINTQEAKNRMYSIISKNLNSEDEGKVTNDVVSFSTIYKEMKTDKEHFSSFSAQYAFVILLLLANEKNLHLDQGPSDLYVKKDINEI